MQKRPPACKRLKARVGSLSNYQRRSENSAACPVEVLFGSLRIVTPFDVVVYQASGGQLMWLDEDAISMFVGSLQQQGSLTGIPATAKTSERWKSH